MGYTFHGLNPPSCGVRASHGGRSIIAGGGWHYNEWTEYTKIYVLGRTKVFLPCNAVCLNVREIAATQRWCTGITLVHAHVCQKTHPHRHKHAHVHAHTPTNVLPVWKKQRVKGGGHKQCSEADVITKGNTSRVSPSLCDPHGGSKSELIRVPQNGRNLPAEVASGPCSFQM